MSGLNSAHSMAKKGTIKTEKNVSKLKMALFLTLPN
jgi:hypothetical protein